MISRMSHRELPRLLMRPGVYEDLVRIHSIHALES